MKLPILCPFCNDVMLTNYPINEALISKECSKRPSHGIKFFAEVINSEVYEVIVRTLPIPLTYVKWLFKGQYVRIETVGKETVRLPWFDPDLSNFNKLVDKVNTYLVFS